MTNQYTSLELSRLIQSKVPEVGTEKWYSYLSCGDGCKAHVHGQIILTDSKYSHDAVPAYRLDDVLRAIKVWGERKGNQCAYCLDSKLMKCRKHRGSGHYLLPCVWCTGSGDEKNNDGTPRWMVDAQEVFTAYLADNGLGERSEKVIRDIFE